MDFQELKQHILSQMPMEQAFDRMLMASQRNYEKLKFRRGEEVDPVLLMLQAAMDLNWNFVLEETAPNEQVRGLVVGTEEYINNLQKMLINPSKS